MVKKKKTLHCRMIDGGQPKVECFNCGNKFHSEHVTVLKENLVQAKWSCGSTKCSHNELAEEVSLLKV